MWQIVNGAKYGCWKTVLRVAQTRARQNPGQPTLVKFVGRKKAWPNHDDQNLDFYVHADGTRDYSVDPTWEGHPTPP